MCHRCSPKKQKTKPNPKKKRYNCTPIRIAKIQNNDHSKRGRGCGEAGTLTPRWWESAQSRWKTVWWFKKLNILLLYDPAIALLGIYPNELKIYVTHKAFYMSVYSSFIHNPQTWKQTRCSSAGERIKCGAFRQQNIIQPSNHEETWRKLKCMLLSKRGQFEKATYCTSPTI